jgi:hypothetical protein
MNQRDECVTQAPICREEAKADPARYDYWIDVVWRQRAIQARRRKEVIDILHGLAGHSHAGKLGAAERRSQTVLR